MNPVNYRGITVTSILLKVVEHIPFSTRGRTPTLKRHSRFYRRVSLPDCHLLMLHKSSQNVYPKSRICENPWSSPRSSPRKQFMLYTTAFFFVSCSLMEPHWWRLAPPWATCTLTWPRLSSWKLICPARSTFVKVFGREESSLPPTTSGSTIYSRLK